MPAKMRCVSKECPSHKSNQHFFKIEVTVDDEGEVLDDVKRVEGCDLTCCYCGNHAELVLVEED